MSIRFAAARRRECSIIARVLAVPRLASPANDTDPDPYRDALTQSALQHFARHGLAAAARAHAQAKAAFFAGDAANYAHWRAICAMFDRQLAQGLARSPATVARGHRDCSERRLNHSVTSVT